MRSRRLGSVAVTYVDHSGDVPIDRGRLTRSSESGYQCGTRVASIGEAGRSSRCRSGGHSNQAIPIRGNRLPGTRPARTRGRRYAATVQVARQSRSSGPRPALLTAGSQRPRAQRAGRVTCSRIPFNAQDTVDNPSTHDMQVRSRCMVSQSGTSRDDATWWTSEHYQLFAMTTRLAVSTGGRGEAVWRRGRRKGASSSRETESIPQGEGDAQ